MNFFRKAGAEIIRSAVIALVVSSTFAGAAVWQWSTTAGTNSNSDPHIDWHIGMAPSSVGSSSRAEMAELAKYRDDISGLLTTGGTSVAYTVTSNQGLCISPSTTPQDGQQLSITVNSTNGASPTLQADSCSAYPIQSSAGVAVGSATMVSGSPYTLRFSVANSAWMLRDFYSSPSIVPLGGLVPYTGSTSPNSNFILPAGQCISTTTYAAYWALMGSPASGSCAGGQFQVIDLRGRVPAALDNLNGTAANRLTASSLGCGTAMTTVGAACANGVEQYTFTAAQMPTITSVNASQSITVITGGGGVYNIPVINATISDVQLGTTGSGPHVPGNTGGTSWSSINQLSGNNAISVTSNNTGGQAHSNVPPTIAVTYLLRVL